MPEPHPDTERLYVGHLHGALKLADSQHARVVVVNSVLSIALGALAVGVVSAGDTLEISGLSFKLPVSTLILGASGVCAALYIVLFAIEGRRTALRTDLWRRYGSLGMESPGDAADPFLSSSAIEMAMPMDASQLGGSKFTRAVNTTTTYIVGLSVLLLPIAAQVAAIIALLEAYASRWAWLTLAIPLFSVASLASFCANDG